MFFKAADKPLVTDLRDRGLLFRLTPYEHSYPHCWRCDTALLYYALPSWYIRTTAIKDDLLRENERTAWHPDTIKHGRYGDWLRNNIDWALSRNRYWGTPLPLWRCENGHLTCVASRAELGELVGRDLTALEPHRPYVDEITFACDKCGELKTRVPEVIDGWYDSGAMPFAQFGYPHLDGEEFASSYPADFIAEAIDQTRGWFYTLMAVGTLVFDQSSYRTVLCLGHILAEDGRKMSKHLGNILEPIALMDKHSADALRWYMLAGGSPWAARRIGDEVLEDVVRKVLLTYWNTTAFFVLYANASAWMPGTAPVPDVSQRPLLDRWGDLRTARHGARSRRSSGGFRFRSCRPPHRALHRRLVELVRQAITPPFLGWRRLRAVDLARMPRGAHPVDGAVHSFHHRRDSPALGRRRVERHAGLRSPA